MWTLRLDGWNYEYCHIATFGERDHGTWDLIDCVK